MSIAHPDPHPNRESWLNDVVSRLRPAFAQMGAPLPERLRIVIGFPSTGRRAKATGECWNSRRPWSRLDWSSNGLKKH